MTENTGHPQAAATIPYTLGDYWVAIYRRKWIILLIVVCAAVCSGLVSEGITPRYESKAEFYVPENVAGPTPGPEQGRTRMPSGEADHAKTYITVLKGQECRNAIFKRFPEKPLRELETDVDFMVNGQGIVRVYVRDTDPQLAADVANGFVAYFDEFNQNIITSQLSQSLENIGAKVEVLAQQRDEVEDARKTYQEQVNIGSIATRLGKLEEQRLGYEEARENSVVHLAGVNEEIVTLEKQLAEEDQAYKSGEILFDSTTANKLRESLVGLEVELAGLREDYRPDHPTTIVAQRRYDEAKRGLEHEIARIVDSRSKLPGTLFEFLRRRQTELYVDQNSVEARIKAYDLVLGRIRDEIDSMPNVATELDRFNRQLAELQTQIQGLHAQRNAFEAQLLRLSPSAIVLEAATPAGSPSFPITRLNIAIAAVGGLIVGLAYALLLDYMEQRRHLRKLRHLELQEWSMSLAQDWFNNGARDAKRDGL